MKALKITKDRLPQFIKELKQLTGKHVLVGVPGDTSHEGTEMSNSQLAAIHEFGSPAAHIPPRPFLVPGVQKVQDKLAVTLSKGVSAALDGNVDAATKALHTAGLQAVASVKREITSGDLEPLAPSTLAARKREGFEGERPLVVTGGLLNSITYVVEEDK